MPVLAHHLADPEKGTVTRVLVEGVDELGREFHAEVLMPVTMVVVVRRGSPLAEARSLEALREARWVYTGMSGATGYARRLFEQHGLQAPQVGATVNSTLGLLSLIGPRAAIACTIRSSAASETVILFSRPWDLIWRGSRKFLAICNFSCIV